MERKVKVDEFDAELEARLAEAHERARTRGRNDVADYILLRAANDQLRAESVARLLEDFTAAAGEANREGAALTLERTDSHRFQVGNSTMVGTRLVLRAGVRALTIEAGWPRTPRDGIVRGGGLAAARISHFGDRAAGDELLLTHAAEGAAPRWLVLEETGARVELLAERVRGHVARLLTAK
ncbi:MAG TPA: hypothetical protein VGV59_12155 [Pyrinomonadaceae bacterium]|nr:hypothetical protein [Pyrinomonadaceae bacterium]